jgi:hypothetical protein
MRAMMLGWLLLPAVAAAEPAHYATSIVVQLDDPAPVAPISTVADALRVREPVLDACWTQPGSTTVKVSFAGGKVAKIDAHAAGDSKVAACIASALRPLTLPGHPEPVTATYQLSVDAPPSPAAIHDPAVPGEPARATELNRFSGLQGNGGLNTPRTTTAESPPPVTTVDQRDPYPRPVSTGGPAPGRSVTTVDFGPGPTGDFGTLGLELIERVVTARKGVFRACYQKALNRASGDLAGTLVVAFAIAPDGSVPPRMHSASTARLPDEVSRCVRLNVQRLKFPAAATPSRVSYPFVFSRQVERAP